MKEACTQVVRKRNENFTSGITRKREKLNTFQAYDAVQLEKHRYVRDESLPLLLRSSEHPINASSLPKNTKRKFAQLSSTIREYYATNNGSQARIERFVDEMWSVFTSSGQANYTIFKYMSRNTYYAPYLAAFVSKT